MPTELGHESGALTSSHDPVISGTVCAGSSRGKSLGFPTANLRIDDETAANLSSGVYAARVGWEKAPRHSAVVNVGYRPTFEEGMFSFEVHVLDFTGDLYGKKLDVRLVARIRDEMRFDGAESLVDQIRRDIAQTRNLMVENEVHT
jgi:riboflavin kinase/FMN adenylyltransferase